ncbi:riboflavin synthase [Sporolactobacillus sp. THM7-4]|nr:riboflavin synthase [Sporolactobacillus sp. THM7-4]
MFTGLIEEIGHVDSIEKRPDAIRISIQADRILDDAELGDSIAVNGVCLTITSRTASRFSADVMPETIQATTLKNLRKGDPLNLERAMKAGDRYGGHMVAGHVDATGRMVRIVPKGNARYIDIEAPPEVLNGLVQKGSVAIDGTSLTVFHVDDRMFTISLIPHTFAKTILGKKKAGDMVNIECDMMQKYIRKQFDRTETAENKGTLTYEKLKENGFIPY